jgi:hypothetical protein
LPTTAAEDARVWALVVTSHELIAALETKPAATARILQQGGSSVRASGRCGIDGDGELAAVKL